MRVALAVVLLCLSGCASEKLALAPPSDVDFSGHWKLNEADSDDPLHLVMSQDEARAGASSQRQGGQGGRGGRRADRGGDTGVQATGVGAPIMPPVGTLSEGLRWPGKDVEIKQVAGMVAITSMGFSQVYQPVADSGHHHTPKDSGRPRDRSDRDRGDGPPPVCGWDEKTLVVQSGDAEDRRAAFEERYRVSEDRQRLFEVIAFKGGRSGGFTVSRVWDRVVPGAPQS